MRASLFIRFVAISAIAWASACSCGSDSGPASTERRDSGRPGPCGEVGEDCCSGEERCRETGAACDDGFCCAENKAARCLDDSDCCNTDAVCNANRCCIPDGERCESDDDCCEGLECNGTTRVCEDPFADCGLENDPCDCPGNTCSSGFVCIDDSCERCGRELEQCCPGDQPCDDGNRCVGTFCEDCGDVGERCCGSENQCRSGLECDLDQVECVDNRDNDCLGISNCVTCNRTDGCAWCDDSFECRLESERDTCRDWCTTEGGCDDPDQCGLQEACSASTCSNCLDIAGCGWCTDGDVCERSNASESGPEFGSCGGTWLPPSASAGTCP